jgi:hypothetical protein
MVDETSKQWWTLKCEERETLKESANSGKREKTEALVCTRKNTKSKGGRESSRAAIDAEQS